MKQILTSALLLCAVTGMAQTDYAPTPSAGSLDAAVTADLQALNAHFTGIATFRIDKRDQLVTAYISNGAPYRTDEAYLEFLDATSCTYSAEENTVMVQCQDPRSKCITKEIHKNKERSTTGRMNLPVPSGDAQGEKTIRLLSKLIDDKQSAELQRLAETNTRGDRKN